MESAVMNYFITQGGPFAILFVVLLFYVLRVQERRDTKSEQREQRSAEREKLLIEALHQAQENNEQLALTVRHISKDIEDIKNTLKMGA